MWRGGSGCPEHPAYPCASQREPRCTPPAHLLARDGGQVWQRQRGDGAIRLHAGRALHRLGPGPPPGGALAGGAAHQLGVAPAAQGRWGCRQRSQRGRMWGQAMGIAGTHGGQAGVRRRRRTPPPLLHGDAHARSQHSWCATHAVGLPASCQPRHHRAAACSRLRLAAAGGRRWLRRCGLTAYAPPTGRRSCAPHIAPPLLPIAVEAVLVGRAALGRGGEGGRRAHALPTLDALALEVWGAVSGSGSGQDGRHWRGASGASRAYYVSRSAAPRGLRACCWVECAC